MTHEFHALTAATRAKRDAAYWRDRAASSVTDLNFTPEELAEIAASMAAKAHVAEDARRNGARAVCAAGAEEDPSFRLAWDSVHPGQDVAFPQ